MTDLFEFESEEDLVPIVYEGPFVEQGEILFSYDMPDESKEATTKTNDWAGGDLGFDMNTEQPQNFEENEPSFPISNFAPSLSFNNNTIGANAAEDNSMMFTSNSNTNNNASPFTMTPSTNSLSNNSGMSFNSSNFRPNANSGMSSFDEIAALSFSSNAAPTFNNSNNSPGLFVNTNLPALNFNTGGTASFQQPAFNGAASPTSFNTIAAPNFNAGQASPSSFNSNRMSPNFNAGQASPSSFNSAHAPFGFRSNSSGSISFSTQNFHFPTSAYQSDAGQVNNINNISMMQGRVTNDINANFMNVAPLATMNNSNSMSLFSNDDATSASAGYQGYPSLNYTGMPGGLSAQPVRRVRSASSPANIYTVSNFSSVALQQQHFPTKSEAKLSLSADSGGPSYSSSGSNASADEFSDEFSFGDEAAEENELQILEIASKFTLPSSKSPIIEAMAFCAVHNWGISIVHSSDSPEEGARVIFLVKNFSQYCRFSRLICSKRHPTHNEGARIKALRRWFVKFPKKKERKSRESFILEVKPDYSQKVHQMIERYKHD